MKYIAFHMEEPLYRKVIAMKGKRKWSEMMQDIVQARADLRAAIGKTDEIKDSINHDLEPEHRVLSEDP